jgi:hypothetical protein
LILDWVLDGGKIIKFRTQKSFALTLGVSEARASQMISAMENQLQGMKNGTGKNNLNSTDDPENLE